MDGDGNVVEDTARVLCVLTGSGTTPRPRKREMEQNRGARKVGGRFKRKGTYVYLWLVHVNVWQKPTQFFEAIVLQLKKKFFNNEKINT